MVSDINPCIISNMAHFQIYPLSRFESGQTSIKRPKHFLRFSYDENRECHVGSDESLRYYYPPFFPAPGTDMHMPRINLSGGFESWIKSDQETPDHLDALLATIENHESSRLADGEKEIRVKADVVTWRGMMTKILSAAFDDYSDFEMNATCFQDTIYIEQNHSYALQTEIKDNRKQESYRYTGAQSPEMYTYWGYKFESLSTLPRPWSECSREEINSRDNEIINNNIQYCSIARTGIGNSTLIIGGEVDCIMGEKPTVPDEPVHWVELKTSKELSDDRGHHVKFEKKLCRMWAQSFLLGVPTIVIGFRDDFGNLTRIMDLETQKIPGHVAQQFGTWDGNVCINLANQFLELLKQTVMGTQGVWRIKRGKNSKVISIVQMETSGTGDILSESFKWHREKVLAVEITRKLASTTTDDV